MEGLIPYLIRAMKKQRPQNSYRSFSVGSTNTRSYHLLNGGGDAFEAAVDGSSSSHRRTRSDFQAPTNTEFLEQRSAGIEFIRSRTVNKSSSSPRAGDHLKMMGSHPQPHNMSKEANRLSNNYRR